MSGEAKFERERYSSRSRSRSPFRKNLNEQSYGEDDYENRRQDFSPDIRSGGFAKNRVFVNDIPSECHLIDIRDLFREKVGAFVELFEDDLGKFKGCGVDEFKNNETALEALKMKHKHEIHGRQLNVKIDSGDFEKRHAVPRGGDRDLMHSGDWYGNNDFRSDPQFNAYSLNPEFLKSLGIVGPLNNKVFISNLDCQVTEKKLEEIFKIAGKISKVELNVDNEGKSKGHGTAEFEHSLEAVQAISMFNGQRLYSRIINVCMDTVAADGDAIPSKLPSGLHGIGKGLGMNGHPMQFNRGESSNKLECAVCLQQCIQPVQLPCRHIFCYLCVKGVAQQSKRCAMCRQEIPLNYLDNPQLIFDLQPSVAFEGEYQWFYEGRNGWWQYDDRRSTEIEAAFKNGDTQCEVLIAGFIYIIDFQKNLQVRKSDDHRCRRIKRDLVTISKKGVAGIRAISSDSSERKKHW